MTRRFHYNLSFIGYF